MGDKFVRNTWYAQNSHAILKICKITPIAYTIRTYKKHWKKVVKMYKV